jgi:hypothetical protein
VTVARHDDAEVEALRTDRYLETLLAARDDASVTGRPSADVDPAIAMASGRLGTELIRVHPSFRFEERLARRLAEIAAGMRLATAAGGDGRSLVVPFPGGPWSGAGLDPSIDPAADDLDAELGAGRGIPRPVVIGGAVASAALSIAGAAFVAWRLGRPASDPMTRAVRLANEWRSVGRVTRARLD